MVAALVVVATVATMVAVMVVATAVAERVVAEMGAVMGVVVMAAVMVARAEGEGVMGGAALRVETQAVAKVVTVVALPVAAEEVS